MQCLYVAGTMTECPLILERCLPMESVYLEEVSNFQSSLLEV